MSRVISHSKRHVPAGERRLDSFAWNRIEVMALAAAMIALFARVMTYPLQHDEQFYVSAGVLFSADGLYPQLGFSHLPNLPMLLHLLYALPVGAHYLLIARLVIYVAWVAAVAAVILIGRQLGGEKLAVLLMAALLIANPLLLGATGMAATNNFIAIPFALFGLLAFLKGLAPEQPRPWMLVASGCLLALAAGFKINYAVLVLPFAVTALLVPKDFTLARRVLHVVLPLLAGGIIGALPILFFLVRDPWGLLAHVVTFHRGPQIAFWLAHPDPVAPKIMGVPGKLLLAEQLWFSGGTMVLVTTLAFLTILMIFEAGTIQRAVRAVGWPAWLIAAVTIIAVAVSFPPTPAFPQYFALPIPFALVLVAALHGRLDADRRAAARPFMVAAILLAALTGVPTLLSAAPGLIAPRKWTGIQVHADAQRIAALVRASPPAMPLATLGPLYALEGGRAIYPQLGLGPFIYRAADYIPPDQRRYFHDPVSPTTITALLRSTCPAGVLIGLEGELDTPLAAFARSEHYLPQQIMLHAAEQKAALLLVRPLAMGNVCGQAPIVR
ncbi:MAG: hypothetical protein JWR77_432 [Rhizorhabdus sp.]|nr:hypothetical protein [Rhizorhabdus sp.]